jgi:hypothetical protein
MGIASAQDLESWFLGRFYQFLWFLCSGNCKLNANGSFKPANNSAILICII